jgi:hypothetical protein
VQRLGRLDGAKAQLREADIVDTLAEGFGCTEPTWGRALHRNASRRAIPGQQGGTAVEQMWLQLTMKSMWKWVSK